VVKSREKMMKIVGQLQIDNITVDNLDCQQFPIDFDRVVRA
jgi:hypothetical protein